MATSGTFERRYDQIPKSTENGAVGAFVLAIALIVPVAAAVEGTRGAPHDGNLLSLERMGAGAPGGWRESGSNYEWQPEPSPGPLGVGAARIQFGAGGKLTLDTPARYMPAGLPHAAALWLRSKPTGANVELALCDNDSPRTVVLLGQATATETWQKIVAQDTIAEAVKGRYYLRLSASGDN